MSVVLLREMFERMVIAKNAELVPVYYHPDFLLTSQHARNAHHRADAGPTCTSPEADQVALARTRAAVNLLGADTDGVQILRLN